MASFDPLTATISLSPTQPPAGEYPVVPSDQIEDGFEMKPAAE